MASTSVKSYFTLNEKYDRIIVLIDMDAFYCQVEEKHNPELKGKPIAVCQYMENSGIIAVNYPARALGISRHMREREAKAACKDLVCVKVASKNGKADISKYRKAGSDVAQVFQKFTDLLERASIDEAYLDITDAVAQRMQDLKDKKFQMQPPHFENTFAVGYSSIGLFIQDVSAAVGNTYSDISEEDRASFSSSKLRLLVGGTIVSDIRKAVFEETGYTCSAGIAHNKILAKLVCGMNKPNKQTILPLDSIHGLFEKLDISKIKSMGGKTGEEVCQTLNVKVVNDLLKFSENELKQHFGDRIGNFLFLIARGVDLEKVRLKINSKSIGVSKNFRGKSEITNINTLKHWLSQLAQEVKERVDTEAIESNRYATQLTVQFSQFIRDKVQSFTRVVQLNGNTLNNYTAEEIVNVCYETIEKNSPKFLKLDGKCLLNYGIRHLGITTGKFEDKSGTHGNISSFFNKKSKDDDVKPEENNSDNEEEPPKIRVKSDVELKGIFAKYERSQNQQMETPVACEEKIENIEEKFEEVVSFQSDNEIDTSTESIKNSKGNVIKAFRNFNGDNSIRGLKTLKYWICELFREIDKRLMANVIDDAPEELEFNFVQSINGSKATFKESIPLFVLSDNVISADFIIDALRETSSNFMADDNTINPISYFEIKPTNFKDDGIWKLKLFEDMSAVEETKSSEKINEIEMEVDDKEEVDNLEQSLMELPDDEPMPSTSKDQSYKDSYVELKSRITIDDLNPPEECQECGKMIRKFDMQTHVDGHFAMKLAQEQREEYRNEQKQTKPAKIKTPTQKVAAATKNVRNRTLNEIFPFLNQEDLKTESGEDKVLCFKCNKLVPESEIMEHMDHHYAQALREEQMKTALKANLENNKRKKSTAASSSNSQKKIKSVKDFFGN